MNVKLEVKNCLQCGQPFAPRADNQKYCSVYCRDKHPYYIPRNDLQKSTRVCDKCGAEFIPNVGSQRFCSGKCREAYYFAGRFLIFERDEFRCIYCGKSSIHDKSELRIDHIHPRKFGGEDIASNLVTACERCNLEKSAKLLSPNNLITIYEEVNKRNEASGISHDQNIALNMP